MIDTATVGLRERKKARMREHIETTALDLFARDGYDATTVDAITAACEVSPRTFFRYFATKHDLLHGDTTARLADFVEALRRRPAHEPPLRSLRAALAELAHHYEAEADRWLQRLRVFEHEPALRAACLENQHVWQQAIVVALAGRMPAYELRLAAGAATAAMLAALELWYAGGGTADLAALTLDAFDRLGGTLDG